jgi:hypothetical protein
MDKFALYYFAEEVKEHQKEALLGQAFAYGGAKLTGLGLKMGKTFNPLTKTRNLTPLQRTTRKTVQGKQSVFGPRMKRARNVSTKVQNTGMSSLSTGTNLYSPLNSTGMNLVV